MFFNKTLADSTAAPEASVTVPETAPPFCAKAGTMRNRQAKTNATNGEIAFCIRFPPRMPAERRYRVEAGDRRLRLPAQAFINAQKGFWKKFEYSKNRRTSIISDAST